LIPPDPIHRYINWWFRARRRNFTILADASRRPVDGIKPLQFLININVREKPVSALARAI